MAFYKAEEVMEVSNAEDVAYALGLDVRNMGGRKGILCPGHLSYMGKTDTHFGNAVLSEKGYYCFGCNRFSNVFAMTMQVTGCTFPEAVKFVADTTGRQFTDYSKYKKKEKPAVSLTHHDYELLGLTNPSRHYNIKKTVNKEEAREKNMRTVPKNASNLFVTEEYEALVYDNEGYSSLQNLLKEDKETYVALVLGKVQEAVEKREKILKVLSEENSIFFVIVNPVYKDALIETLRTELWEIKRIAEKVKKM